LRHSLLSPGLAKELGINIQFRRHQTTPLGFANRCINTASPYQDKTSTYINLLDINQKRCGCGMVRPHQPSTINHSSPFLPLALQ
jgi:hypothetical protein